MSIPNAIMNPLPMDALMSHYTVTGLNNADTTTWHLPEQLEGSLAFKSGFTEAQIARAKEIISYQGPASIVLKFARGTWTGLCLWGTYKTQAWVKKTEHGTGNTLVTVELRFMDAHGRVLGTLGTAHCHLDGSETRRFGNWQFYRWHVGEFGQCDKSTWLTVQLGPHPPAGSDQTQEQWWPTTEYTPETRTSEEWTQVLVNLKCQHWFPFW